MANNLLVSLDSAVEWRHGRCAWLPRAAARLLAFGLMKDGIDFLGIARGVELLLVQQVESRTKVSFNMALQTNKSELSCLVP